MSYRGLNVYSAEKGSRTLNPSRAAVFETAVYSSSTTSAYGVNGASNP